MSFGKHSLRHVGRGVSSVCVVLAGLVVSAGFVVSPAAAQEIAITVDDLPAHSVLPPGVTRMEIAKAFITALHGADVPPTYGFVNGIRIQENPADAAVLDAWRAAGDPLGNHTWSHMNLNDNTLSAFEADVLRNEPVIESRMEGKDWRWLRFPYLAEGNTTEKSAGVREFLQQHGYKIAAVTMSFGDYLWNEPYARCSAKGDQAAIRKMESTYLAAASADAEYRRAMAKELFGHDIPYVLLMHIGAFDARMLPRLLKQYQSEGFHFVSLDTAEQNPFYANDLDLTKSPMPDTLAAALHQRKLPFPPSPPAPVFLNTICK